MPSDRRAKKAMAAAQEDRISALPDGVLQLLLGFLPAHEAVRTCVLARHWRHQGRSMCRLRIDCGMPGSTGDIVNFVNRLLLLRVPGMAIDELEVSNDFLGLGPEMEKHVHVWIQHALMCKVQALIINLPIRLDPPLVSQHLRNLELTHVHFCMDSDCLDFLTCPTLEVLDIKDCNIYCSRILSHSIKHLRIRNSCFHSDTRGFISMPSLISLQLNMLGAKAPLLEFMPSLQTASVKPSHPGVDTCMKYYSTGDCCGICACCCGEDDQKGRCVLLGGLSNAIYLELIAPHGTSIFRRDLRWCPTFSKLKRLLLNEWFVAIDLSALVCILEHSPVLEKLILLISQDAECETESEIRNHQMERVPQVSEHLKIVEIKCTNVGFRVFETLSFLSTFVMQVNVIRVAKESDLFSFVD